MVGPNRVANQTELFACCETTRFPTTRPIEAPTPRPIVNTVGDCGRHHVDCSGYLGAPWYGTGITCPAAAGNPDGRCQCDGPFHCRGTEVLGPCANPRDHCFERGVKASPTSIPTSSNPTAAPTTLPTVSPTGSKPTPAPIPAPTGVPSPMPIMIYPTDGRGRPIFPTNTAGNELYLTDWHVADWRRQPIVPTDRWGEMVLAWTISPTASPTAQPTAAGSSGAAGSAGKDADSSSNSGALIAVVVVSGLLLIGVVVGAGFYVKSTLAKKHVRSTSTFGNPVYDSTPAVFDSAQQSAGRRPRKPRGVGRVHGRCAEHGTGNRLHGCGRNQNYRGLRRRRRGRLSRANERMPGLRVSTHDPLLNTLPLNYT